MLFDVAAPAACQWYIGNLPQLTDDQVHATDFPPAELDLFYYLREWWLRYSIGDLQVADTRGVERALTQARQEGLI